MSLGDLYIKSKLTSCTKKNEGVTQLVEPVMLGWAEESKILTVCFCFLPLTLLTYLPANICGLPGLAAGDT